MSIAPNAFDSRLNPETVELSNIDQVKASCLKMLGRNMTTYDTIIRVNKFYKSYIPTFIPLDDTIYPIKSQNDKIVTMKEKLEVNSQVVNNLLTSGNDLKIFSKLHQKLSSQSSFIDNFLDIDLTLQEYNAYIYYLEIRYKRLQLQLKKTPDNQLQASSIIREIKKYINKRNNILLDFLSKLMIEESDYTLTGGLKRYRSKPCTYKYYLKAFKTYSKRKLKTFRKRRNYKKTKRGKH
jgi:hypothetical protein